MLTPARRTTPWLGRGGLALIVLLYLLGCAIIFNELRSSEQFLASTGQMLGAGLTALGLIAGALALPRRVARCDNRWIPRPLALGVGAFIASSTFFSRPENWLGGVILALVFLTGAASLIAHWSRQRAWTTWHQFALIAGVLPTYAWGGFILTYLVRPESTIGLGRQCGLRAARDRVVGRGWPDVAESQDLATSPDGR